MRFTWREFGLLLLAAWIMFSLQGQAQVNVGDNLHLNLSGDTFVGFNGTFPDNPVGQSISTDSMNLGGVFILSGNYYHPQFLNFVVSPYYNQSRLNSNFNSISAAKGLRASANLFSGSSTPGSIDFEKDYNRDEQFNIPDTPGFHSNGDSMAFNVAWGFLFKKLPSIHVNYGIGNNSASILGSDARSLGRSRVFGIGANYSLLGFNLGAGYSNTRSTQRVPELIDLSESRENTTHQNTLTLTASRRLTRWASFTTTFNRTHFRTDLFSQTPTEQSYKSVYTSLNLHPLKKLDVNANLEYNSNLSALFAQSVLPTTSRGNSALQPVPLLSTTLGSDSEIYSLRANYQASRELTVTASTQRVVQHSRAASSEGTSVSMGVGYGREFLRGQLGLYYGYGKYSSETEQSGAAAGLLRGSNGSSTHTGGVTYSHRFTLAAWRGDSSVRYSRHLQMVLFGQTASSLGGSVSIARDLGPWGLKLGATVGKMTTSGLSNADSLTMNFNANATYRKFSLGGSYTRSDGNSLQTSTGLQPAPLPGLIFFPNLLVLYNSSSYAISGSYTPSRRLRVYGNYNHSLISTNNGSLIVNALFLRYDMRTEYIFRQLRFSAGFSHLSQGIGVLFNTPAKVDAMYVGISRHFDLF